MQVTLARIGLRYVNLWIRIDNYVINTIQLDILIFSVKIFGLHNFMQHLHLPNQLEVQLIYLTRKCGEYL